MFLVAQLYSCFPNVSTQLVARWTLGIGGSQQCGVEEGGGHPP